MSRDDSRHENVGIATNHCLPLNGRTEGGQGACSRVDCFSESLLIAVARESFCYVAVVLEI